MQEVKAGLLNVDRTNYPEPVGGTALTESGSIPDRIWLLTAKN
jgi:hypothetical protein